VRSGSLFAWQYLFQGGRFEVQTGLYYTAYALNPT
jgi:hypothetical protein